MAEPVLAVENLSLALDGVPILDRVSFAVGAGEWFAIIGPNGAGKTTLFRCLARIHRIDAGSIRIEGRPLESYSQRELAGRLSYVPQISAGAIPFRAEEYVMMGRYPHLSMFTSVGAGDRSAVREAMTLTGTAHLAPRRMDTLSGGERQLVAIAAALAQGANIMLLDEPVSFLDPGHAREVHRIIGQINRGQGITILMVTHDINSAAMHADRIGIMQDGCFIGQGTPSQIMSNEVLSPVYGTVFAFQRHPESGIPVILPEARS